mgnify:CR=1 FL=1
MNALNKYTGNKLFNAIQVKYILPFLLIVGLMFSLFIWFSLSEQQKFLNEELEAKGFALSSQIEGLVRIDLLLEDTDALNKRLEYLQSIERDFESSSFYNSENQLIASIGKGALLPAKLNHTSSISFNSTNETVSILTPIFDNTDLRIGHFILTLSKNRGRELIWSSFLKLLLITLVLLMITTIIMVIMAQRINNLTLDYLQVREISSAELKESYEELEVQNKFILKQNAEKETMLKEIHHRVKNNMQIIISLLRIQSSGFKDERLVKEFQEAQNRIFSMALIHEKMYLSEDLARVDLFDYLSSLVGDLINTYTIDFPVKTDIKVEVDELSLKTLVPVGLIINEVVSNSLKHAFVGHKDGVITLKLTRENKYFILVVGDNGIGINNTESKNTGLGMELIETFVSQISGEVKFLDDPGTLYEFTFIDDDLEEKLPNVMLS